MMIDTTDTSAANETSFHTQGPLPPDAGHLYVYRHADAAVEKLIASRDYVALIGPRLSGKSSMLLHQWARLRQSPLHLPIYLSLGQLKSLSGPQWFSQVHLQIARQTGGLMPVPREPATHALALEDEIVTALETTLRGKVLVLLLDQIETVPPEVCTSFFATVREMFVNRWMNPLLNNVSFVLAGRFVPDELIKDPTISPFRVTEIVYLEDADLEHTTELVSWLATARRQLSSDVPARIFEWTEGDVYLTHKLCAGLARDITEGAILLADVDRAARRYLYEDDIFRKMWSQVQADPEVLALVTTLLAHRDSVRFTLLQRHIMLAWLEGAIKSDPAGYCVMHSLVHESVFYSMQHVVNGNGKTRRTHAMNLHEDQTVLVERYRLDHVLHPGLTSYVYRATDLQTNELVAIKQLIVSRELNEMAWHRFQREADALKHLHHPYIVHMLDAFREGDFDYIVMEYVYGGSLFDRLNREGRLPVLQAIEIMIKLAGALAYAHSRGIIHRDIKPSNTMLTPDLSPRLADFGVARLNYHSRVTLPQTVIGTTPYLSPEGCQGETLDERGDIWSLGVMLYEMLAGTLPFVGRTDDLIARSILNDPVPDICIIRPDVPPEVAALIGQMLNKSLSHRIQTAQEVYERLRGLLARLMQSSS